MKKLVILLFVILVAVSLFADTETTEAKWKTDDSGSVVSGYTNQYAFKVVFKGDENFNIGFSQSQAVLTTSNGLQTLPFENNTLTLSRVDENPVAEGGTISFSGNCYIYWYVSYISQFNLKMSATAVSGSSIIAYVYDSVSATTVKQTAKSSDGSMAKLENLGESGKVGYVYGSRYIKLSVDVKSYPADGRVGSLTLTLET